MSRFSKAAAEAAGWVFYHDSDEVVLRDGDNEQGISKKVPASVRAEKMIDLPGQDLFRTTEEAPTLGKLLERIHAFEQHLEARLSAPDPEVDKLNRAIEPENAEQESKKDSMRLSPRDKQLLKQKLENERVAEEAKDEDLSPAEPGAEDEDLDSLNMAQLRSIAKEKGVSPIPRRKKKLVAAIKAAK